MRIRSITVSGLHPYLTTQAVDLDALQGPLVAVTGPNGAGKSTLLELALAALYLTPPTRGDLYTLAARRGAFVEVVVELQGRDVTIRHTLDPLAKKRDVFVSFDGNDGDEHATSTADPRLATGKVRDFAAWAADHLPTREVALASLFSAQASTGFLGAKPAERKAILLRALGIDRLERMASVARERTRDLEKELATIDARIEETEKRATFDREARTKAEAHRDMLRNRLGAAEMELDMVRVAVQAERDAAPIREQHRQLRRRLEELHTRRANGVTWLEAARARIATIPAPPPPAALTCAKAAFDHVSKLALDAHASWSAIAAQLTSDQREAARLGKEAADAFTAVLKAERDLEESRAEVRRFVDGSEDLELLRERVEVGYALVKELEASLAAAREVRVAGAEERIAGLRGGLEAIRDFDFATFDLAARAETTLLADDALAAAAEAAPEHVRALEAELATTRGQLHDNIQELAATERALDRFTALRKTIDLDALQARETALRTERDAAEQRYQATKSADYRAKRDAEQLMKTRDGIATELDALQQRTMDAAQIESERARMADGEARLAEIDAEIRTLTTELDAIPEPAPWKHPRSPADLEADARRAVDTLRRDLAAAEASLATHEAAAHAAAEAMTRLEGLVDARAEVAARLADTTKLADDLGRDGLQAMELDAAGPELSALATDLLHEAFGPRWTVSFETLRSSADGKREIETLEVRVLDTHTGYEGPVEALSGGERAIVGEAVSLALTVLACRGAGLEAPTLVRDESGAALDAEKSEAYVRMLRAAAELVGASRVLFVSHDPRAAEMADSRIEIADGVVVRGGGVAGAGGARAREGVSAESEAA